MRKITFLILSSLLFICSVFSQTNFNPKSLVGKFYWTKIILAREGNCKIEITPNDISPNQKYCNFQNHLEANSKIKLKESTYQKQWAKLTFVNENKIDFVVFLKNDSKQDFQKSFDLAFSKESISEDRISPSCDVKTKLDVIRKIGFPSEIQRKGESEIWFLGVDWIGGFPCGFDTTRIEIQKGVVTQIGGTI